MDKKKLTDEEIIKALECCAVDEVTDCENGQLLRESCAIIRKYALDLIHRLQAENEKLRNSKVIQETVDYCAEDLKKAQAEIEQMEKENEELTISYNGVQKQARERCEELQKQVDELKEENKTVLNRSTMWKRLHTKVCEENAELQKQVDELTAEKENLYFQNQNLQTYIDNHEPIWKRNTEKAVKDTAKEICDLILEHWQGHDLVECDWLIVAISEKYGLDMK